MSFFFRVRTPWASCLSHRRTCRFRQEASTGANVARSVHGFINTPKSIKLCKSCTRSLPLRVWEWTSPDPLPYHAVRQACMFMCRIKSRPAVGCGGFELTRLAVFMCLNIGLDLLQLRAWLINLRLFFCSADLILIKVYWMTAIFSVFFLSRQQRSDSWVLL